MWDRRPHVDLILSHAECAGDTSYDVAYGATSIKPARELLPHARRRLDDDRVLLLHRVYFGSSSRRSRCANPPGSAWPSRIGTPPRLGHDRDEAARHADHGALAVGRSCAVVGPP